MTEGTSQRILVIEDDQGMAELLKSRLESAGFQVQTEGRGGAGLSQAQEHRPDLVILDLRLPDMGGYEVCTKLRKLYDRWDVPILMLTGMDKPIDELRGFAHGADAYLTKPYEPTELLKTVAVLLGQTSVP